MVKVDTCCCCFSLRTGCFIIGYMQLVYCFILTVASTIILGDGIAEDNEGMIKGGATLLPLVAILDVFTALFVYGVHKERRNFIKAFLIFYWIVITSAIIGGVVGAVGIALYVNIGSALGVLFGTAINSVLPIHYAFVIGSYHESLA